MILYVNLSYWLCQLHVIELIVFNGSYMCNHAEEWCRTAHSKLMLLG